MTYWEIGKPSHELDEEDWKAYFLSAKDCDPVNMQKCPLAYKPLHLRR